MKPYFETKLGRLYNCDCLDFMKEMEDKSVDLVLTDPPYGINADLSAHKSGGKCGWVDYGRSEWDKERPSRHYFEEMLRVTQRQIIWGGNYFTDYLYPTMGWLVWDKGQRNFSLADGELAWTSFNKAMRIYTVPRSAALKDGKKHPTQKSLKVMEWCILYADRALKIKVETIFDPFLGSGTTAVACEKLKRRWVGIEISEKYCEVASKRISLESRQGKLF